jgi:hypothetical protein
MKAFLLALGALWAIHANAADQEIFYENIYPYQSIPADAQTHPVPWTNPYNTPIYIVKLIALPAPLHGFLGVYNSSVSMDPDTNSGRDCELGYVGWLTSSDGAFPAFDKEFIYPSGCSFTLPPHAGLIIRNTASGFRGEPTTGWVATSWHIYFHL